MAQGRFAVSEKVQKSVLNEVLAMPFEERHVRLGGEESRRLALFMAGSAGGVTIFVDDDVLVVRRVALRVD